MISKNQIKQIQALHQKKYRDINSLFLAEGIKTVLELITVNSGLIKELFCTADFAKTNERFLNQHKINYIEISDKDLAQISTLSTPNKVIAVCYYFPKNLVLYDFQKYFSIYLDDIRDPGNFGTIVRLADWYGISTIFCSPTSCDLYNPKVIQATMGAFNRVHIQYALLKDVIESNHPGKIYGAVLKGLNVYKEKLSNGLIVIGNEANGITKENLKFITHPITIPSHDTNGSESLNAAMATGIITSEFFRQLNY